MEHFQAVHDRIFSGREILEGPFVDSRWTRVLIPCTLRFPNGVYEAIGTAALAMGDAELVITVPETIPPHEDSAYMDWDRDSLESARSSIFGHFDTHLFGLSGSWGVVCDWEDYCCVGGNERFMDLFVQEAGGMAALEARFLVYAKETWGNLGPEYEKWVEQLLRSVGWEAR